jgi:predicted nucleic acid-binding Zn ribbon protein
MKKVGDLLREFLKAKGWLGGNPYEPLFSQWQKIAGESMASHVRLLDVHNNTLVVEVDHPGWLQMLRMRQEAILEAARKAAPHVSLEAIRARVGGRDATDH